MSLSKKQWSELLGKVVIGLIFIGLLWLLFYSLIELASNNHKEPTQPDYKIETDRGFEYPKY